MDGKRLLQNDGNFSNSGYHLANAIDENQSASINKSYLLGNTVDSPSPQAAVDQWTLTSSRDDAVDFWNPPWLWTSTLIGLASLFLCLIVSLLAVFVISLQKHGITSPQSNYRLGWTYGPTIDEYFAGESYTLLTLSQYLF